MGRNWKNKNQSNDLENSTLAENAEENVFLVHNVRGTKQICPLFKSKISSLSYFKILKFQGCWW